MRIILSFLLIALVACSTGPADQTETRRQENTSGRSSDKLVKEAIYYDTGELKMKGQILNGERHGVWKSYFRNGGVWSTNKYSNGVQHGPTEVNYESGLLRFKGHFTDGQRSGKWRVYDENGQVIEEINYDLE